jgi:polyhydroxyalkanoate synthase
MAETDVRIPTPTATCAELRKMTRNLRTFNRLLTTDAKIAQTPKEVVWTLNKAKLYRYIPIVPEAERKKLPLFMVFAVMNRPYVLDLRPGHSFVEYMLKQGYDLHLLDWGIPGPEDRKLKFDDYVLDYLPRAIPKIQIRSRL